MPGPTEPHQLSFPRQLQHGDWFCGKSVGLIVTKISGIIFNVYVTHVSTSGKDQHSGGDKWPYPSFAVPVL